MDAHSPVCIASLSFGMINVKETSASQVSASVLFPARLFVYKSVVVNDSTP